MESQTRNTESLDSRLGIGLGIGLDVKTCIESDSESVSNLRPGQYQSQNRDSKIGTRETLTSTNYNLSTNLFSYINPVKLLLTIGSAFLLISFLDVNRNYR